MAEHFCAAGIRTVAVSWIGDPPAGAGLEHIRVDATRPSLTATNLFSIGRGLPRVVRDLWRLGFFGSARDLRYGQLMEAAVAAMRFPALLRALDELDLANPTLIVNGAHYWPALLALLARQRIPDSKLIVYAKGLDIERIGVASPRGTRFLLVNADTVVVASEHMRRVIVEHLGLHGSSIERIPNPVELPDLPDLPAKDPSVLFVGVLEAEKDPETFVRAAASVCARVPQATFTLVGEGQLRGALEELVVSLGVADSVRFAGRMDNSGVLREMTRASALVLPSRREAFGLVLVEAMATYTPCVVTDVGGMPEVITSREGFVVGSGDISGIADAVSTLLEDRTLCDQMGRNARERAVQLYSIPVVIQQWQRLLA